jgi:hypothetical protein
MNAPVWTACSRTRVHKALEQPVETTLHDVRWGEKFGKDYVWVFLISGAAPPAHFAEGWKSAEGFRQPPMYFPNGGATLARHFASRERSSGRASTCRMKRCTWTSAAAVSSICRVRKPSAAGSSPRRSGRSCSAVTYGVSRDQLMAKHQANHIQVAYATDAKAADECMFAKAAMARALGMFPCAECAC